MERSPTDYVEPTPPAKKNLVTQHQDCEAFINLVNANVQYGGYACYVPATDTIHMPKADVFVDTPDATAQSFYSTSCMSMSIGQPAKADQQTKAKGKFITTMHMKNSSPNSAL